MARTWTKSNTLTVGENKNIPSENVKTRYRAEAVQKESKEDFEKEN